MVQIVGKRDDGTPFLALRLEPGNLERLKNGQTVRMHVEDLFPAGIPKKLTLEVSYTQFPLAETREAKQHAEFVFDEKSAHRVVPHCPECKTTIENVGASGEKEDRLRVMFCSTCGCVFGLLDRDLLPDVKRREPFHTADGDPVHNL